MSADRTPKAPGRAPSPNLRPPWRKGQSGNPAGRKRGKTLRKLLAEADVPCPKEFLLTVMHDKRRSMALRIAAARAVIGYVNPRLNSTDIGFGNLTQGEAETVERFTLRIFDPHNGPGRRMLPPPNGGEHQEDDNDPTT